jgi:chloramphenicol 3-O-phosphotransferase
LNERPKFLKAHRAADGNERAARDACVHVAQCACLVVWPRSARVDCVREMEALPLRIEACGPAFVQTKGLLRGPTSQAAYGCIERAIVLNCAHSTAGQTSVSAAPNVRTIAETFIAVSTSGAVKIST